MPFRMSIGDFLLGRPLASSELKKQALTPWTGMPLLGLDSLASTGYGPEAALTVLSAAGVAALRYFPLIVILLVAQLGLLYFSYRQTAEAYPNGGGAYNVTKDNFRQFWRTDGLVGCGCIADRLFAECRGRHLGGG